MVEDDLLVYPDGDLLDGDFLCFGEPVWVGAQFDVHGYGVQRPVAPARQAYPKGDEMVCDALCALRTVVHAEGGQGVVALDRHGEGVLLLLAVALLDGDNELVKGFCGARGQLQAGGGHAARDLLAAAAVGYEDDKGQVHTQDALVLAAGRAAEQQHLLADQVGDVLARGGEVLLGDRVGGRVDGLAAVQGDGDERDVDGGGDADERAHLDLALYAWQGG